MASTSSFEMPVTKAHAITFLYSVDVGKLEKLIPVSVKSVLSHKYGLNVTVKRNSVTAVRSCSILTETRTLFLKGANRN